MFKSDNSITVLIGKSISRTASVQVTDSTASTFIADGEVVVLDSTFTPLVSGKTISDSDSIFVAQGNGTTNPTIYSIKMRGSNVRSYRGLSFLAPQEQIDYIGYNGTSGSIEANSLNTYKLRLTFKHDKELWSTQKNIIYDEYVSDSTATQSEIVQFFAQRYATGLPSQRADVKLERVTDGTFTVLGGSSTLTVTNGSTTATASSSSHGLVVGSVVRIGGTSSTTPVYLVASTTGTSVILDSAYKGNSGVIANANVGSMASIASWGLKITGKPLLYSTGKFKYLKVAFDTVINNWGATPLTNFQTTSMGNGAYEQVADYEWFAEGFEGFVALRNSIPYTLPRANAVSGTNYDTIVIESFDSSDSSVISASVPSPNFLYLFLVDGAAQTTNILAQLNPWMASLPRSFDNVTV